VLLGGCGGGDGIILPRDAEPAEITIVDGDEQRGRVREPLNEPLVVQVTDTRGRPVPGATVAFELTAAGSEVVPHEKSTDADGLADARVVLGTTIGRQTGNARVVTPEGRPPVQTGFSAMALSESANRMEPVAGQDQTGHVGRPLDDRLVVEVTDGFGNPVAGVPITWTVEGGGSVSPTLVDTDEDGRVRADRTLGLTIGRQTTIATSEGLAGSPITFVHTALPGDASRLIIISGDGQTAASGSPLPAPLVVRLIDAEGNGVDRTAVAWVVAIGGGNATPDNSTTDSEGLASGQWTLGETLGPQRLDAVVSGVGVASFNATATAGAPASLFIATQPSSSARNGVPFERQPVIQIRDARGNDVALAGVPVSVEIASGGGELSGTRVRNTDAAGRATFTDLAIAGDPGPRTLDFTASGYAKATSSPINITAVATITTITSDSPDPSVAGSVVTVNFGVTSPAGIPAGSVTVSITGSTPPPPCTVTLSNGTGTCQFTLNVVGDRLFTATYSGGPGLSGSSDTEPHTVVSQPPQNKTPTAEFDVACSDLTCTFTDKSKDDDGTIVSRSWDYGDGTSGAVPSHTYGVAGTYQVTLTVTDNGGAVDSKTHDAKPTAPPPQVLEIDRQPAGSAIVGEAFDPQPRIQLRAGGRDVETAGVVVSASIASGGGTLGGTTTATTDGNGRAEFSNLSINGASGPHTLRFTAAGFAEVISRTIDIGKAGSTTTITSDEPDPSIAGSVVTVNVQVSSGIGIPTGTVTVSVSGASPPPPCTETLSNGTASCQFTLNIVGDREFTAEYSGDGLHNDSQDQEPHRVDPAPPPPNEPPTAAFDPPSCTTGQPCQFTDTSTDSDGTIASWNWDFGTFASPTSSSVQHPADITYAVAGTYPVTLTVTDDVGDQGSVTHTVTVTD
jgi:PKD repeat protein